MEQMCTRHEKILMFHNSLKNYLFPALQEFKHAFPNRTIKCGHPFSCHVAASFKYTENKGIAIYTKIITNYWKMKINVCNKAAREQWLSNEDVETINIGYYVQLSATIVISIHPRS